MAPNQKTTQPKRPKTNCFLTCFGISSKPSSSKKKKPKKIDGRKKFFKLKIRWPKLKVITIEKRRFSFDDAKAATLKTSHDIILEATKAHQQLKRIDHHVSKNLAQEPKVPTKGIIIPQDKQSYPKNQLYCNTCHKEDPTDHKVINFVGRSWSTNKVIKDSLLGMTIMIAMLVIMSIWGRFCAILCMSAWLYCIPLFRGTRDIAITRNNTNTKLDNTGKIKNLNLELYKKKVVLQGLLQRDHKNAIGIS